MAKKLINRRRKLNKIIKSHDEWIDQQSSTTLSWARSDFDKYIDGKVHHSALMIADSLDSFAQCYAAIGIKHILSNKSAKTDINKAFAYLVLGLKLKHNFYSRRLFRPDNMSNSLSTAACLACFSPVVSEDSMTILRSMYESPKRLIGEYSRSRRSFEEFVYVASYLSEQPFEKDWPLREPYRSIAESWNEPEKLASAIVTACDYHLLQTVHQGGDWDPEFDRPPFDIIPCEVVFIRRLRAELGLEMPTIDHELVELYDTHIGEIEPYPGDELLDRAKRFYETFD